MNDVVLSVENVSKRFRIGSQEPYRRFSEVLSRLGHAAIGLPQRWLSKQAANQSTELSKTEFWALKDVSFEVREGEVLGIIGRNGAGKSTLLKILSRITEPTSGRIGVRGRIGSLLEVGTGFHPELTGRENIYLNGAILGMNRAEVHRHFDEIVAFAEIEQFLDTPVKRYSSGMYVRLGFAVAAHLSTEILIVDEVLAVGDAAFQKKCLGKMGDAARSGRTVLFVSHNMVAVRDLCDKLVVLSSGQSLFNGNSSDGLKFYHRQGIEAEGVLEFRPKDMAVYRRKCIAKPVVTIDGVWAENEASGGVGYIPEIVSGQSFYVVVSVRTSEYVSSLYIAASILSVGGDRLVMLYSGDSGGPFRLGVGSYRFRCRIDKLNMSPGKYVIQVGVNSSESTEAYDAIVDAPLLKVVLPGRKISMLWESRPYGVLHMPDTVWSLF